MKQLIFVILLIKICTCDRIPPHSDVYLSLNPMYRWKEVFSTTFDSTSAVNLLSTVRSVFFSRGCKEACISELAGIVRMKWPEVFEEEIGISAELSRRGISVDLFLK